MAEALVTGAAGFIGSHLCDRLLAEAWRVTAVDSFLTGDLANLAGARGNGAFSLVEADVSAGIPSPNGRLDVVFHLASPASPSDYLRYPIETLRVGALGTLNALELARERRARFVLGSTSEVYGDPLVHPQPEAYWGNVNPIGPRSVYDEAKRYAEAATAAYRRDLGLDAKIVRIFNTFGPRMRRNDGRAVPTFIAQALRDEPLTVHGDGSQTRSLCFVGDLVGAIVAMASSELPGPVNVGSDEEWKILELAHEIITIAGSRSDIGFTDRPIDDPSVRCPDLSVARTELRWEPVVSVAEGLAATVEWARTRWS
jgi:dTDP-glucose 4,6-dehydratase